MPDARFDQASSKKPRRGGLPGLLRRLAHRLLRPVYDRQTELYRELNERLERLEREQRAGQTVGWDHVAMARRLAAIEDHLRTLAPTVRANERNRLAS